MNEPMKSELVEEAFHLMDEGAAGDDPRMEALRRRMTREERAQVIERVDREIADATAIMTGWEELERRSARGEATVAEIEAFAGKVRSALEGVPGGDREWLESLDTLAGALAQAKGDRAVAEAWLQAKRETRN